MQNINKNKKKTLAIYKQPNLRESAQIINLPEWINSYEHPLETSAKKMLSGFARVRRIGTPSIDSTSPIQSANAHQMYQQMPLHEKDMKPWEEAWLKAKARTRTYF